MTTFTDTSLRRVRRAGLVLGAGFLLIPGVANAATSTVTSDGTTATVTGSSAAETIEVQTYDGQLLVRGADASGACTQDEPGDGQSVCPIGPGGVDIRAGEGADHVYVYVDDQPDGWVRTDLGGGNDVWEGRAGGDVVNGGAGSDELNGYGGADVIDGGTGDDMINGMDGDDVVRGGEGNDFVKGSAGADVIDGGTGIDKVDEWAGPDPYIRTAATVTLDGVADDGLPGEGDNVTNVETIQSFSGLNFVGTDGPENVQASSTGGDGSMSGRGGDDVLNGSDRDEKIDGGAGNDDISGGFGNDTISGGPGQDRIAGDRPSHCNEYSCDLSPGSAIDVIDARDGERDSVSCGPGLDTVFADAVDVVENDCETINRGATNNGGGGTVDPGTKPSVVKLVLPAKASLRGLLRSGWTIAVPKRKPGAKVVVKVLKGKVVVATGTGKADAKGVAKVKVKVTKAGKSALKKGASAKLTLTAAELKQAFTVKR